MIRLEGVSKHYPGTAAPAVDGVSLEVPRGTTTALIGPSGCGKSTLLRLILGLIEPTAGRVEFDFEGAGDGTTLSYASGVDGATRRRRACGYVIQDGGLFPHLTARGNVALLPETLRMDSDWLYGRIVELCELTAFPTDGLGRYPGELSGGQRQRVALMRALVTDPPVLLMDEPLGALDPMIRYDLQRDLRQIFRDLGKTVVLVTHDLAEAAHFGDEVVLMRGGRVVQRGPAGDLADRPAEPFVREFVTAQRGMHDFEVRDAEVVR